MSRTVIEVFEETAARRGDAPALKTMANGVWQAVSWTDYRRNVRRTARAFMALGLEAGDGLAILSNNNTEWVTSYLAGVAVGAVPAGLYLTSSAEQVAYIVDHADATILLVDTQEQLDKALAVRDQLPKVRAIVTTRCRSDAEGVVHFDDLAARADAVDETSLQARIDALDAEALATLIYTSGTTGNPKGVMLSHRNLTWTGEKAREVVGIQPGMDVVSYLPLCHIAEQNVTVHVAIASGLTVWFAESLDALGENLKDVRPHMFVAVPRVWEKMQSKLETALGQATGVKKRLVGWARGVGLKAARSEYGGGSKPWAYPIADKLIFSKLKAALGLDRSIYQMTGAAPISQSTLDFFASLGLMIYEVYGQSESTGAGTISLPGRVRPGSIGRPLDGTEVRIADDGEILLRGPHVAMGYYKNADATADTIDADGWLHTGDIGHVDPDGFVHITDRKKELIITAGGENISPQALETQLNTIAGVSQVAVIGDKRRYLTALFTLDAETLPEAARAAGSSATTPAEAAACETFRHWFDGQVGAINGHFARVQTIKKYTLLGEDFTVESGELTPTMKKKRRVIHDRYSREIEAMYAD